MKSGGDALLAKLAEIREHDSKTKGESHETQNHEVGNIFEEADWSLHSDEGNLSPLKFSNKKTQEDIVKEAVKLIKEGNKVIFIKGVCGTGKSAIALNIARKLGRASIVVPFKTLQNQYRDDYTKKKYLLKSNGQKLKITMITGRDNHPSMLNPGTTCADPSLPENIRLNEKNSEIIKNYYRNNPFISSRNEFDMKNMRRISIAPANPYWSPILPADIEVYIPDAKKKKYRGLGGKDFTFYHRKSGCTYYDQYQAYIDSDVIIFNSAKYKIETDLNRKPHTDVEIIDEADEFLDSFSTQMAINISRLNVALKGIPSDKVSVRDTIEDISNIIRNEEINKRALGVDENQVYQLKDTSLFKIMETYLENPELEDEILFDETSYANKLIEMVRSFYEFTSETYLTYRKYEDELYASLVTTNLSQKFKEMVDKNKAMVLMSGTFHSDQILKNVFGVQNYKVIEAEIKFPGTIEIVRTGKEFDCRYTSFSSKEHTREEYLEALSKCLEKAQKPTLIHVNAFEDLPSNEEVNKLHLNNIISKENLMNLQSNDKSGNSIEVFKSGLSSTLFTTKCSRGADFPGKTCNSIIFTKYPNPNPNDTFWKILKKTHPQYFWEFYKDKAYREFLQKIYRGLRFEEDYVQVLSPDTRVLEAVREMQLAKQKGKH